MAAQFEECREKITEMPGIIRDLCRVLYFGKVDVTVYCLAKPFLSKGSEGRIFPILGARETLYVHRKLLGGEKGGGHHPVIYEANM